MDSDELAKEELKLTASVCRNITARAKERIKNRNRKTKRKTVYEKVKNFILDKKIAESILERLPEKPKYSLDDQGNYHFSRAVFYKSLAALMKLSAIKSHRSNFFGHISGQPEDVNSFYQMISPDYLNGPITNQSLHVYMSDMSRKSYHELVQRIHAMDSTAADSVEHGTHVLRTLLATVEPHVKHNYKLMNREYASLDSIPLPLLSYLTKQPLNPAVMAAAAATTTTAAAAAAIEPDQDQVTNNVDTDICQRFKAKFDKLVQNCHLIYTLDVESAESRHIEMENPAWKVEYDQANRLLRLRTNAPLIIAGFQLGTSESFKKIVTLKDREFVIPNDMTHVFISCKNAYHCVCGKIRPTSDDDEMTAEAVVAAEEHTDEISSGGDT